jgi:hypothetical protein
MEPLKILNISISTLLLHLDLPFQPFHVWGTGSPTEKRPPNSTVLQYLGNTRTIKVQYNTI